MKSLLSIVFPLAVAGDVFAHELPPAGCSIEDWRFQVLSGIVTIEGVLEAGWAGNQIHIQAYDGERYLGNVDGYITGGGSFTAMATGFPSVGEMRIRYHCD